MAFRNRSIPRAVGKGARRKTNWGQSAIRTDITALAAGTVILTQRLSSANIITAFGPESTIIRTRGHVMVTTDQSAATENVFGAYGIAIVSEDAAVAGVASIPSPYSNADWDGWFVHGYFFASTRFADATGFTLEQGDGAGFAFDSKAMRKLEDLESVVVLLENGSATAGMFFGIDFRMLFKLH